MPQPSILVVDDDANAIHLLGKFLAGMAELRFARSGEEALRLAQDELPDIVLLDVGLPGIDGFETCRRIKANPRTAAVPVIFVTRFDDEQSELAAMQAGAADFLCKPLTGPRVQARVQAHWRVMRQINSILRQAGDQPFTADTIARPLILIVDDDKLAILALHQSLRNPAAEFVFARSGAEALEAARRQRPDLVLLDIMMPGLDGIEVARRMRDDAELRYVPIVVVTRYGDPAMEAQALDAGATDFIAKPYSEPVLQARVRNALRLKHQADSARRLERDRWRQLGDERLADVIDAASDAIITLNASGEIQLINRAAQQLLAVSVAQSVGQPLASVMPVNLRPLLAAPPLPAPGAQRTQRALLQVAGRAPVPVECCWSVAGTGTALLCTLILRDLSERERAEQALREQLRLETESRTKTLMMGFLAHEIGNPLNGVVGFSQLALADSHSPLPEAQRKRIEQVAACSNLIAQLLKDVLEVSQIEAGQFKVQQVAVDLDAAVQNAMGMVAPQAAAAGICMAATLAPSMAALADPVRLQQCLLNLLSNAIKYNRPGGRVDVRVYPRLAADTPAPSLPGTAATTLVIEVEDTGLGMTPDQLAQLFEPFNRLGRANAADGTGIGLVLTRLLIGAMGGQIEVHSLAGQGSRFRLCLPACERTSP